MNKEVESKSIEATAKEYAEKIVPIVSIKNDRVITNRESIREDVYDAFKAGYSLNQSLRWVKASERLPSETKPYNIKYGIAPEVGWYNSLDKQFYGDVLEKYPLDNKSILWLDESPSLNQKDDWISVEDHIKEVEKYKDHLRAAAYTIWKGCQSDVNFEEWKESWLKSNDLLPTPSLQTPPVVEAVNEQIKVMIDLLKDYEQWEADIINEDKLWWPNRAQDVMSGKIYDTMMKLQKRRNQILKPFKDRKS